MSKQQTYNALTFGLRVETDTQTDILRGIPLSAICVQNFDDSQKSAIHITYRISLRSSSLREPRYPLLPVVSGFFYIFSDFIIKKCKQKK